MNSLTIQRTIFQNYGSEQKTYGYRAYDEYGQEYNNVMDESDMTLPPLEFFEKIKGYFGENMQDAMNQCEENNSGVTIDGVWYDGKELW